METGNPDSVDSLNPPAHALDLSTQLCWELSLQHRKVGMRSSHHGLGKVAASVSNSQIWTQQVTKHTTLPGHTWFGQQCREKSHHSLPVARKTNLSVQWLTPAVQA